MPGGSELFSLVPEPANLGVQELVQPTEMSLVPHKRMTLCWTGSKASLSQSARVSAESSAAMSAILAASPANHNNFDDQHQILLNPGSNLENENRVPSPGAAMASGSKSKFDLLGSQTLYPSGVPLSKSSPLVATNTIASFAHWKSIPPSATNRILSLDGSDQMSKWVVLTSKYKLNAGGMISITGTPIKKINTNKVGVSSDDPTKTKKTDPKIVIKDRRLKTALTKLRQVRHTNLTSFYFGSVDCDQVMTGSVAELSGPLDFYMVMADCAKASVEDTLASLRFPLPYVIMSSLATDLARGLAYLHKESGFGAHGRLNSRNCYVDGGWRLKISGFGVRGFMEEVFPAGHADSLNSAYDLVMRFLFVAPEELERFPGGQSSFAGDIYRLSFVFF
jgi:hypothetical protein